MIAGLASAQRHYDRQEPEDFGVSGNEETDVDQAAYDADLAAERNDRRGE